MTWNWQLKNWPKFTWNESKLGAYERAFNLNAGVVLGASNHISEQEKQALSIQLLSSEALDTSAIEGEYLDRDSVQSSIKKILGFPTNSKKIPPAEAGIAALMVDVHQKTSNSLTEATLCRWQKLILGHHHHIEQPGNYRTHVEAMEIISGPDYAKKIHFVAPPSNSLPHEMKQFITWFNHTSPDGDNPLPPLTRAGIAHIWFESIHPFEDGNGRIGRAISEKTLSQGYANPIMTSLATQLLKKKKAYYAALGKASLTLDLNAWLAWFAKTVLEAQHHTYLWVHWIIEKTKFMQRAQNNINSRQEKILLRLFQAGPEGFIGGLSAKNYMAITGATSATTTRDLRDLVEKKYLKKTGERKATRYALNINNAPSTGPILIP